MKASEEIAIDFFIQQCISSGIENQHKIVEAAKKGDEREASKVKQFLLDGKSIPYENDIEWEDCMDCGGNLMFDDNNEEYFCPICER